MSSVQGHRELVVRPSGRAIRRALGPQGGLVVVAVGAQFAAAASAGRTTLISTLGCSAAVVVAIFVTAVAYARRVRFEIGERTVRYVPLLRRSVEIPRDELDGFAFRTTAQIGPKTRTAVVLYDKDHRRRASFMGEYWEQEDLRTMAQELKLSRSSRRMNIRQLNAEFPGAVSILRLHGTLTALVLCFVTIALAVVAHYIWATG